MNFNRIFVIIHFITIILLTISLFNYKFGSIRYMNVSEDYIKSKEYVENNKGQLTLAQIDQYCRERKVKQYNLKNNKKITTEIGIIFKRQKDGKYVAKLDDIFSQYLYIDNNNLY